MRPFGGLVGNHIAEVIRNNGRDSMPADLEAFVAERPEYDYMHHARADSDQSHYVRDDIIDRLCLVGPADSCVTRLRELATLGVTHVNFYAQTENYEEQMEIYAGDIIPQLRTKLTV